MLESHNFAQTEVRLFDDLCFNPEFVKSLKNVFLKIVETVDRCVNVGCPNTSNVRKTSNPKLVKARVVT